MVVTSGPVARGPLCVAYGRTQGMADGVRGSAVFVLFLSRGVLDRPFVRFEVSEALKHRTVMFRKEF